MLRLNRPGRGSPSGLAFILELHRLADDRADGVRRLPPHPLGGMGVGVQGEPGGVVALIQNRSCGKGLHIGSRS